ncbi:MAG: prolyl oligopeptidase family serine peptidase, partial [Pseudomonadota bacterium]
EAPAPVLVGHSAGAHIAALLIGDDRYLAALERDVPRPSAFVGMSGPYAFDPTTWDTTAHIFATTTDNPDAARPVTFASRSFPPTLLIHGSRDQLVTPNASVAMRDALSEAGAEVTLKTYGLLAHGGTVMAMVRPLRWVTPVFDDMLSFVRAHGTGRAAERVKTGEAAPSA